MATFIIYATCPLTHTHIHNVSRQGNWYLRMGGGHAHTIMFRPHGRICPEAPRAHVRNLLDFLT
jgi:hypothetical protein